MGAFPVDDPASPQDVWLELAGVLALIEQGDTDYDRRYPKVLDAASLAAACGYRAGIRIDPLEPEWPVIYLELPTGQVSWHMAEHATPWDGHDTDEKYRRCRAFAERVAARTRPGAPDAQG